MIENAAGLSSAGELTRRLLAREGVFDGAHDSPRVAAALERTCAGVAESLRDALGDDGCDALLARALARTHPGHPLLKDIGGLGRGDAHPDGLLATVEARGAAAVTGAIEAFLASVIDILVRLIGADMATRLIEPRLPQSPTRDGAESP